MVAGYEAILFAMEQLTVPHEAAALYHRFPFSATSYSHNNDAGSRSIYTLTSLSTNTKRSTVSLNKQLLNSYLNTVMSR